MRNYACLIQRHWIKKQDRSGQRGQDIGVVVGRTQVSWDEHVQVSWDNVVVQNERARVTPVTIIVFVEVLQAQVDVILKALSYNIVFFHLF